MSTSALALRHLAVIGLSLIAWQWLNRAMLWHDLLTSSYHSSSLAIVASTIIAILTVTAII